MMMIQIYSTLLKNYKNYSHCSVYCFQYNRRQLTVRETATFADQNNAANGENF